MGETFLASFAIVVLDQLTSNEALNVASQEIQPQLMQWTKILKNIRIVLADAELKQYVDTDVKNWLNKLEDLAYDMDDTIDGFTTDQVGQRTHSQASSSSTQVYFNPFSTSTDLITKIDEISARLQEIFEEKDHLYLKENNNIVGGIQFPSSTALERMTSSSLARRHVYGREEEKKAIVEILLNDEAIFGDECVVPIVGMGGVGKTTLAQLVYNDEEVNSFFDLKAWACVGFVFDKFDVLGVTKKILESLTKEDCNLKELDPVHVRLQEKLLGKKFLVVLDDIWKIECDEWNSLNLPFLAGARGSKIIVTTRFADVAKNMSRIKIRELKQLGDQHSLSLLTRHALGRDSFEEHQDLKEIGEKIVKRCQGLPLAITTVGDLLRTKEHQSQWEHILHTELWDLSGRILPALLLNYHYLPSHLKRCFAACAIIPKDFEFSKKELILLWMAMGLLRQSREMNVEDFGAKCFDDLLSRSFFQNSARNESQFVMHDLIIDAAKSVAGEICCRWEDMLDDTKISKRVRYSSFTGEACDVFENFEDFNSVQRLRTFVSFGSGAPSYSLPDKVLADLVLKFKFLRVLCLRHYFITELPDYIGELKHLRHLDLSYTYIQVLPASICKLYNLLTLSVNCCSSLHNLPADIGNLINLHHLDIAYTDELNEMPCGISKLASLQTLSKFVVGKGSGLKLRELKDLMLRGSLSIDGLEDVMDSQDAEEASLKLKHDLDELEFVWKSNDEHHHDEELEFDVLDKLKPQRNLKKLKINGYRCSKIPSWVGDPSFLELTRISIINCRNCTSLPPLWELPMLKHLNIENMFELRSIGVQFYNDGHSEVPNPSLETLYFDGMPEWEEWSICRGGVEVRSLFPGLRKLTMRECPKLTRIPLMALPSLSHLVFDNYHGLVLESLSDVTSLCTLSIRNAMGLTCLHDEFLQFCRTLEHLDIGFCEKLVSLWPNGFPPQNLVCLKELTVDSCPQLLSLGEEERGLPCNLEILTLDYCLNLEKLPNGLSNLMSLKRLKITGCPKVESFPRSAISPMFNILDIESSGALETKLPNYSANISNLDVDISSMSSLNIESLQNFANLGSLDICSCDGLESFPESLWAATSKLRILRILDCYNFKSLPFNQIQRNHQVSLEKLELSGCPKLENFPDGDLPPNLRSLHVRNCGELLKPLSEWGLHELASLDEFSLSNFVWDDQQYLLPPTLTRLTIERLPNLESLSKSLQNLSSLKKLTIKNCPKLQSFPKGKVLSNLSELTIYKCPILNKRIEDERYCQHILAGIPSVTFSSIPSVKTFVSMRSVLHTQRGIVNLMIDEHSSAAP